jgi:serine carboxypeptidase 1
VFQSLLDDKGLAEVSIVAEKVLDAVNKGLYKEATQLWEEAEMVIEKVSRGVRLR